MDNFAHTALQLLSCFNYLRGEPSGTGPSKSKLELRLASRTGNLKCVVKLLDEVAVEAGLNTRVPHLEGETIFGIAKQKLNLPPGDNSNSHRHDHINYSISKVGLGVSVFQSHRLVRSSSKVVESGSSVRNSNPILDSKKSTRTKTELCNA